MKEGSSMIYAIIGPTGVGKTKLSIMLAKELNKTRPTEIINCDSMQIYKELNIGVAKIKESEKEKIPHHLFNIVSVLDDYSVYDYQKQGRALLDKLLQAGKNIIIVGGTGLYLKALLYNYTFDGKKGKDEALYKCQLIALTRDRNDLYEHINKRVDEMFEEGLLEEVKALYDQKIRTRAVLTAIGYKELYEYFEGKISLEEAKEKIKLLSRRYAKRQYTFFKHQFKDVNWYNIDELSFEEIVKDILKNSP